MVCSDGWLPDHYFSAMEFKKIVVQQRIALPTCDDRYAFLRLLGPNGGALRVYLDNQLVEG